MMSLVGRGQANNFTVVYKTNSTQACTVTNGQVAVLQCPSFIEAHSLTSLLQNGTLTSYNSSSFYRAASNSNITSVQSNSRMDTGTWDELNRASYVNMTSSLAYMIDYSPNNPQGSKFAIDSNLFGFSLISEAV